MKKINLFYLLFALGDLTSMPLSCTTKESKGRKYATIEISDNDSEEYFTPDEDIDFVYSSEKQEEEDSFKTIPKGRRDNIRSKKYSINEKYTFIIISISVFVIGLFIAYILDFFSSPETEKKDEINYIV